ncbi:50S ribosomal L9 C-terminal domain-containing protein, partial [Patescibacteria group bacterium]
KLKKIKGTKIVITSKASEKGQLFGSITVKDITKCLQEIAGKNITEDIVMLAEPIRTTGSHTFSIKLPEGKEELFKLTINSQ